MIHMTINNQKVAVEDGSTILEAARKLKIRIPTLCNLDLHDIRMVNRGASCRICVVEVEGRRNLAPSCSTPAVDGMVVTTNSLRCIQARRTIIELFLSNHPKDCLVCEKNLGCELQALAAEYHIRAIKYKGERAKHPIDISSRAIIRNMDKCVMCRRCETMCNEVQTVNVLSAINRGFDTYIAASLNMSMNESTCVFCGQCVMVCPTAALTEVSHIDNVWNALNDKKKHVVVQTAPAVRVALGEEFGAKPGTVVTGKMVAALRRLGFDKVFDTDFAADLTIMEEATEFIHRLKHGGKLPILTSCCPGWVKFFEHQFNDMLDIPSTSKSPHEMFGAIAKSYYAEKMGIDPEDICVVSVMPCLAKKYESARPELSNDGLQNVDEVVTTRELARMLKEANIDLMQLEDEDYDDPLGESTGASVMFGTSGGVIEAALRTAYEWLTNETLKKVEFHDLRGFDGIKEAVIKINDMELKIAVAHGLGNARTLLENIREGKAEYHGIEIMACPGGCVGGGGQPFHHGDIDVIKKRMEGIFKEDKDKKLRKSHENPYIQKLYEEYLGEPYGEKAHELLHTHYEKRRKM